MAITPTPAITAMPPAPQRLTEASVVFVPKADAFAAGIVVLGPQVQATATAAEANARAAEAAAVTAEAAAQGAIGGSSYMGTTAALLNVALGSQSFTLAQTGKAFTVNMQVVLILLGDDAVRMTGILTAFVAGTGASTVNVTRLIGTPATGTSWAMIPKFLESISPEVANAQALVAAAIL